jgi:hypothetical protein
MLLWPYSENIPCFSVINISSMFSSSTFSVSEFVFKCFVHFELIFVTGDGMVYFHSSSCGYTIFPAPFIEEVFLP